MIAMNEATAAAAPRICNGAQLAASSSTAPATAPRLIRLRTPKSPSSVWSRRTRVRHGDEPGMLRTLMPRAACALCRGRKLAVPGLR